MSYSFNVLCLGPFLVPSITSCYEGYYHYAKMQSNGTYDIRTVQELCKPETIHPSISFNINILSSLILKDILFYFANHLNLVQTLNRLICFNPLNFEGNAIELSCLPTCKVCSIPSVKNL